MWTADGWKDYELLDSGDGMRLERWGKYVLSRPDPVALWEPASPALWGKADAVYHRSASGGGKWDISSLPEKWVINYKDIRLIVKPMGFKHTGVFPEQAANWDWAADLIRSAGRPIRVLNLFSYTGGATVSAAAAGAEVCHVDAAKRIIAQAKENAEVSGLGDAKIRWIVDDCRKFIEREIRRGKTYDAIIMDPPSYGRGASGEVWKLEEDLYPFLLLAKKLLSDKPLFVLVNSYTAGLSPAAGYYAVGEAFKEYKPTVLSDEVGLPCTSTKKVLPCGIAVRTQF
ncbi:MAG: class I SAM-dependent methyltransferase [Clostridia bacterium]|nr:class I SAM-dependent methyltransferase [Clostridia bacterium]